MRKLHLCYLLLQLCVLVASQRTVLDSPANLEIYRVVRNWIYRAFGSTGQEGGRLLDNARKQQKVQDEVPYDVPFPCNVTGGRSSQKPESVYQLRPGDIDVIAALGDSLTAGAGIFATKLVHIAIENRGVTAAGGGQGSWRKYLTLPNIFKEFNPNLIGYALGDSLTSHSASQFNVAETGAMSGDMPFMAQYLVEKMKNDPRIDMKNDWKFISLSIGSNDFCTNMCDLPSPWSILKAHKADLINTIRTLRDNLPRTYFALILPPHLKELVATREGRKTLQCYVTTTFECPCMFGLAYRSRREEYYDVIRSWFDLEEEIASYSEFHTNDFTVTVLPLLKHTSVPLAQDGFSDFSYMSADCFHISQKNNARFANGLWNNLLEPVGKRSERWTPLFEKFLCPTPERPYLTTR